MTVKITTTTELLTVENVKRIQYSDNQDCITLSMGNDVWEEYTEIKFIIIEP